MSKAVVPPSRAHLLSNSSNFAMGHKLARKIERLLKNRFLCPSRVKQMIGPAFVRPHCSWTRTVELRSQYVIVCSFSSQLRACHREMHLPTRIAWVVLSSGEDCRHEVSARDSSLAEQLFTAYNQVPNLSRHLNLLLRQDAAVFDRNPSLTRHSTPALLLSEPKFRSLLLRLDEI